MVWLTHKRDVNRAVRLAVLPLLALLVLPACKESKQHAEEPKAAATAIGQPKPVESQPAVAIEPIGRAEILAAAAAAADAVAAGRPLPQSSLEITNRSFVLRLPFGCTPEAIGQSGQWSFDPRTQVLRISVKPQRWTKDSTIAKLVQGMAFDVAEGFWIERPWTSSEDCPPSIPPASEAPPANSSDAATLVAKPTVGVAQFFGPDTPRTAQRGNRPYTYTGKQDPAEAPGPGGFTLKLQGRITGFSDGQPFHCLVTDPMAQPLCVLAVQFTGVALEVPGSQEALAEWTY